MTSFLQNSLPRIFVLLAMLSAPATVFSAENNSEKIDWLNKLQNMQEGRCCEAVLEQSSTLSDCGWDDFKRLQARGLWDEQICDEAFTTVIEACEYVSFDPEDVDYFIDYIENNEGRTGSDLLVNRVEPVIAGKYLPCIQRQVAEQQSRFIPLSNVIQNKEDMEKNMINNFRP